MEIVSVKFQNKHNKDDFSGREYSYFTAIHLKEGDIVIVPTRNGSGIAKVTKTDVSPKDVGCSLELLKKIESLAEIATSVPNESGPDTKATDNDDELGKEVAERIPAPTF